MNSARFLKYGKWILGGVVVTTASVGVTHCAEVWSPAKPSNVPDPTSKWDYNWDKREPYSMIKPPKSIKKTESEQGPSEADSLIEKLEKKKAKAIRHIILIRHGQYDEEGETDKERVLTQLGRTQAEMTGKRLKNSGINFDCLITSNMSRAIETSEIILGELGRKDLEIQCQDPLLREGAPCLPDPPSSWQPELNYYKDGARIEAAFRKYFHRADPGQETDSYELIVCHANIIRYFFCRALQFPGEAWLRISLKNCSLTVLSILPSGRVVVRALGDYGHLSPEQTTTSLHR